MFDIHVSRKHKLIKLEVHSVLVVRTSNFGAEAERSYVLLRFEAENVLKMFLNYMVHTTCFSGPLTDLSKCLGC